MRQGFDAQALVNRGVFDSLAAADAALYRLDDARREPWIMSVSWQQGMLFRVPIQFMQGSRGLAETHNLSLVGATPAPAPILPQGEIGWAANLAGYNEADADRPKDRVGSPNKPLMRKVNGSCDSRPLQGIACQNFECLSPVALDRGSKTSAPCRLTTGAPEQEPISAGGGSFLQRVSPSPTSLAPAPVDSLSRVATGSNAVESKVTKVRSGEPTNMGGLLAAGMPDRMPSLSRSLVRSGSAAVVSHPLQDGTAVAECSAGKQLEIACQSNSFCPWCAIESPGHGAAPRAGFVSAYRCARHAPNPEPAGTPVQCPQPTTVRDALSHAPAVVLRSRVSPDAAPFHPRLNPNAGVVPAFPKGRWS